MSMSPIPKTAPFAEEEIDLLNSVVGTASPVQRAWLAGFLAGLDASGATLVPALPAAPARPAEPLTIVYASESGNCEKLAGDLAKAARKNGLKPTLIDMADLELSALTSAKRLVVIAATWGEGEPPARAVRSALRSREGRSGSGPGARSAMPGLRRHTVRDGGRTALV